MKEIDFELGTVVTSDWLDAMQEVQSGLAINAHLTASGTTRVRMVAGTGKDQVGLIINGKIRFSSTTVETPAISGAAGTYNIFATADTPDRAFALVATTAAAPAGVTNYRKVGEVVWSGSAITQIRSMGSPAPTHNPSFTGTVRLPAPAAGATGDETVNAEWVRNYIASLNIFTPGDIKAVATAAAPDGWLLCHGQAVSRTTYAALFAAIGTAFGAGDGSTTFNVPDLRGRTVAGLDNMGGTDAGRIDWSNVLGTTGGDQYHTLTAAQSGLPSHGHSHTIGIASGGVGEVASASHDHWFNKNTLSAESTGSSPNAIWNTATGGSAGRPHPEHFHAVFGYTDPPSTRTNTAHGHSVTGGVSTHAAVNASEAHNNMQPTMLLNYCIKT